MLEVSLLALNDIKISKNFNLKEFDCKCGCNTVKVDSELVGRLQELREKIGKPIIITSGYRCPTHNKRVDGSQTSQHMRGKAVDIKVSGMTAKELAKLGEQLGFDGIGTYSNFVHLDVRGIRARWNG